jgi:hypothetical protein
VKCCTVLGHCDGGFLEHLFYRISIAQLALTFCWILQFCCRKVNISCDLKPYNQIYINNCPTRCNTKQSIYYSASSLYMFRVSTTPIIRCIQNCKTVTTASGTGHIFCAITEVIVTVLCTPDDGCGWHPKHVEWKFRITNGLLCVYSRWTIINI